MWLYPLFLSQFLRHLELSVGNFPLKITSFAIHVGNFPAIFYSNFPPKNSSFAIYVGNFPAIFYDISKKRRN